jgi:AraC-like DNA-binding protein
LSASSGSLRRVIDTAHRIHDRLPRGALHVLAKRNTSAVLLQRSPHTSLRESVSAYWGYEEISDGPMRRREGPGSSVVITISLGNEWLIDGERRASFIGGLRSSQVATEHAGWSLGMQIDLVPWAAYRLLRIPMHEIAQTTVPFEQLLRGELVERLAAAPTWDDRFDLLDQMLARQLRDAPAASPEVIWAWQQLCETHGGARVGALANELGWSRKRLVARFREQLGLPPKVAARLLRFEHARGVAGSMGWAELAFACGFADQPHLITEFRAFTGHSPETFLQDAATAAA